MSQSKFNPFLGPGTKPKSHEPRKPQMRQRSRARYDQKLIENLEFRPIPSWAGYSISELGQVQSDGRLSNPCEGRRPHWIKASVLTPRQVGVTEEKRRALYPSGGRLSITSFNSRKPYWYVMIHKDGRSRSVYTHKLMAEAWLGPCPPGMKLEIDPRWFSSMNLAFLSYAPASAYLLKKEQALQGPRLPDPVSMPNPGPARQLKRTICVSGPAKKVRDAPVIAENTWQPIPGLPHHRITDTGLVLRKAHWSESGAENTAQTWVGDYLLRPTLTSQGLWVVSIGGRSTSLARLYARALLGPCPEGHYLKLTAAFKRDPKPQHLTYARKVKK